MQPTDSGRESREWKSTSEPLGTEVRPATLRQDNPAPKSLHHKAGKTQGGVENKQEFQEHPFSNVSR